MSIELPQGFVYQPDLLSEAEERKLLRRMKQVDFSELRMRDRIARRRVAHFGWLYGYDSWKIEPGPPIPKFLHTVRERAGALAGVKAGDLAEVLITEYPPGAPIGWHRDAPMFGVVVAVSLLAAARLRLRSGTRGRATAALTIEPRSAYVLSGPVRTTWQHSISPVKTTRYSITFRTLRASKTGRTVGKPIG